MEWCCKDLPQLAVQYGGAGWPAETQHISGAWMSTPPLPPPWPLLPLAGHWQALHSFPWGGVAQEVHHSCPGHWEVRPETLWFWCRKRHHVLVNSIAISVWELHSNHFCHTLINFVPLYLSKLSCHIFVHSGTVQQECKICYPCMHHHHSCLCHTDDWLLTQTGSDGQLQHRAEAIWGADCRRGPSFWLCRSVSTKGHQLFIIIIVIKLLKPHSRVQIQNRTCTKYQGTGEKHWQQIKETGH